MAKQSTVKKTFSLPPFIAEHLEYVSSHIGVSQSNMVVNALAPYLYGFFENEESTLQGWMLTEGRCRGGSESVD